MLEAEGDALLFDIDAEDDDLDLIAFHHDLGRMLNALGPTHIRDMNQAIDAKLDFDESTERGEIPDLPRDPRSGRILLGQRQPGVLLGLFDAERDFLLTRIDAKNDRFDLVIDGDELRRVPHVAGPAHLGDMNQSLDALLQLDESAVVGDRDDPANDA